MVGEDSEEEVDEAKESVGGRESRNWYETWSEKRKRAWRMCGEYDGEDAEETVEGSTEERGVERRMEREW